ncbi:unnamed protein product [Ectocarpus sp. 4 AP-2014]
MFGAPAGFCGSCLRPRGESAEMFPQVSFSFFFRKQNKLPQIKLATKSLGDRYASERSYVPHIAIGCGGNVERTEHSKRVSVGGWRQPHVSKPHIPLKRSTVRRNITPPDGRGIAAYWCARWRKIRT